MEYRAVSVRIGARHLIAADKAGISLTALVQHGTELITEQVLAADCLEPAQKESSRLRLWKPQLVNQGWSFQSSNDGKTWTQPAELTHKFLRARQNRTGMTLTLPLDDLKPDEGV